MISNRTLTIIACGLMAFLLIRNEIHMESIENRLDQIDNIIQTNDRIKYTQADLDCLTRNVYYEAGVEDVRGKIAVAHVTVNRLKTGYWGNTICKVVYAPAQFSWTLSRKLPKPNPELWSESESLARKVLEGYRVSGLMRSLYYHAIYIKNPAWVDLQHEAGQIGNHIFYNQAKGSTLKI
jgi:spore germination cell wall hydrolase CwlJ-like protein